jgi:hypothetical protein
MKMRGGSGGIALPLHYMELSGHLHSPASLRGQESPVNRASLNVMEKREHYCPYRELNPDSSAVQPVA